MNYEIWRNGVEVRDLRRLAQAGLSRAQQKASRLLCVLLKSLAEKDIS